MELICDLINDLNKRWGVPYEVEDALKESEEHHYAERMRLAARIRELEAEVAASKQCARYETAVAGDAIQTMESYKLLAESSKDAYLAAKQVIKDLKADTKAAASAIPSTFYADRSLAFRIEQLASGWNRAVLAANELDYKLNTAWDQLDNKNRLLAEALA
jgi:hypothetical protein